MSTLKTLRLCVRFQNALGSRPPNQRYFSLSSSDRNKGYLNDVTIIGAGHMGAGIAENAGVVGNNVIIADVNQGCLDLSKQKIEERLLKKYQRKMNEKSEDEIRSTVRSLLQKFQWTTDILGSVSKCDLVVEAIPERLELKHKLFTEIDKAAPPEAIFTTNTSSIPVHEIARPVSSDRKARFGGTHFFERTVKLVEVIKIDETSNETYHKIREWVTFIKKVPVDCKDTPGFIVNRLNIPYFINALRMYDRGDANMKDIDLAMKFGAGYPFGPFELADHIGLDVIHDIIQGWNKRFPNEKSYACPEVLLRLYKEGKFGRKTGEGFYKYN